MSISVRPTSYLVGSSRDEGIRYQQVEQAAQAFLDLPSTDRPFVIGRTWNGQKWTSRIVARTREVSDSGWLKICPESIDGAFSAAYAELKQCRAKHSASANAA